MEFTRTGRGGRKLLYNGYSYVVDKTVEETNYQRCEQRKVCNARIRTISDTQNANASDHSHPPDSAHNSILKALDSLDAENDELLIAKPKQSTHKRENEKWKLFF